jgi:hypothetical protein
VGISGVTANHSAEVKGLSLGDSAITLLTALIGALLGWLGTRSNTSWATKKQFQAQAQERRLEEEQRRQRLLRGLLAEIDENLAAHSDETGKVDWATQEIPYVREMWAQAKGEIGALSERAIKALHRAYAKASAMNTYARPGAAGAPERSGIWGIDPGRGNKDVFEAFQRARAELERWLVEQAHGRAEAVTGARGRGEVVRGTDP